LEAGIFLHKRSVLFKERFYLQQGPKFGKALMFLAYAFGTRCQPTKIPIPQFPADKVKRKVGNRELL
jgi:hypothetical protein